MLDETIQTSNAIAVADIPSLYCTPAAHARTDVQALQSQVLKLAEFYDKLLPLEQGEKMRLAVILEQKRIELADSDPRISRIDIGFLKLKRLQTGRLANGETRAYQVPKFALFGFDSPNCTFTVNVRSNSDSYYARDGDKWEWNAHVTVSIPGRLAELFGLWDTVPTPTYDRTLTQEWNLVPPDDRSSRVWEYQLARIRSQYERAQSSGERTSSLLWETLLRCWQEFRDGPRQFIVSTAFSGILPNNVREQLPVWSKLYDEVLLVAEAPDWKVNEVPVPLPPRDRDPLVLGRIGGAYWLLDRFDVTRAEDYVRREWKC